MDVTRLNIASSLIKLGPTRGRFWRRDFFAWALRGWSTAYTLLQSNLRPSVGFSDSTETRRAFESYQLGEALTFWFAQHHLGVEVVTPVERLRDSISKHQLASPPPKGLPANYRAPKKVGPRSEPDLIGFSGADTHVLECKGLSSFAEGRPVSPSQVTSARNKALFQVCRIATINGVAPKTRTACVFSFDTATRGLVVDPPETEAFDLRFNLASALRKAYASVLNEQFIEVSETVGDGLIGAQIAPGWTFGIDASVMGLVAALSDQASAERLLGYLKERRTQSPFTGGPMLDFGPDGLFLSGPEDNPDFRDQL
ncbi:hypothetical protein [Microvirga tunisiensis]|uniref:Uncharacterized protein n=1 Tax=Microvirga tunisiensis TaxID=2108360 RepID=A0A5N7MQ68_9HYPH|nr:hypothetical protein [Microvirga tunisiensis]MPR09221.1 hypothetical protein [Microvirga tunisiensis]MPR28790.1 hypothetical protein [Microvirga tunisiensis]